MVRVLVVDDHPMWRDNVARDLAEAGFDVVGTAADGEQAIRVATAIRPDVAVVDLQLPGLSGVEVTRHLAAAEPPCRVLVLSASGEQPDVLAAVTAGATGYLVKSASRDELIDAVRRTAEGDAVFTPGLAGLVLGEYRRAAAPPPPPHAPPPPPPPGAAGAPAPARRPRPHRRAAPADRPGDRGAPPGGEGPVLQADRRAARGLAPHR